MVRDGPRGRVLDPSVSKVLDPDGEVGGPDTQEEERPVAESGRGTPRSMSVERPDGDSSPMGEIGERAGSGGSEMLGAGKDRGRDACGLVGEGDPSVRMRAGPNRLHEADGRSCCRSPPSYTSILSSGIEETPD